MKQRKFDPNLICPLCSINLANHDGKKYIAREHIPPRSIFVEGAPGLITVPSCTPCNNMTSGYDLQFIISMGIHLGHDAPAFWLDTIKRLNKDPSRQAFKNKIISKIVTRLEDNGFGISGYKLPISAKPIRVVITKICKGLHWYLSNQLLPSDCSVKINFLKRGQPVKPEIQAVLDEFGKKLQTGNNTFKITYAITDAKHHSSLWILSFYGVNCFVVAIMPKIALNKNF